MNDFGVPDHFADVRKMVPLGPGSEKDVDNLTLTRYACYLVAQNGDSRNPTTKVGQSFN